MTRVFIDGREGTTGLRLYDRLYPRADIEIMTVEDKLRKDERARREALNSCDVAFLCLPDAAAKEAVALVQNPDVRIIDASTAHRVSPGWVYGFPELAPDGAEKIADARRVAVPGCHASGFIALVYPLVRAGILPKDAFLACHSLTGYSGGGKKMIAEYESETRSPLLDAPRLYALGQTHKHLPEMQKLCGLAKAPAFLPVVAPFYSGMLTTVPLDASSVKGGAEAVKEIYGSLYAGPVVCWREAPDADGCLSAAALSGTDRMEISVFGNGERIVLAARFDNLGKGASGAAVECMNLMTGADPAKGLILERKNT